MDTTGSVVRITLLGGLSVPTPEGGSARFETRRAASLLAFLAVHRKRSHPREELVEMLWPEEDGDVARIRFRQVLTTLRRSLEATGIAHSTLLLADRSSVQLNPTTVTTDVAAFDAALRIPVTSSPQDRSTALRHAVNLYTGELLPGFYDDWVMGERRRLEEAYLGALHRLTQTLFESGDLEPAREYARRAIRHDPLREEAYADLLRILAAEGRTADALRLYRDLEHLLWKELRATPGTEAQRLIETLRTMPASLVAPLAAPAPSVPQGSPAPFLSGIPTPLTRFFGREAEIRTLVDGLASSDANRQTRLLTLVGPGGTGKTRLALEVGRSLQSILPGGAWFVPLADLTDPDLIVSAIADVLRPNGSQDDPWKTCLTLLSSQRSLLILDSMEHLVDAGSVVVRTLLEQAASLTCLITSRQRLNLGGEQDYVVEPLPIPSESSGEISDVPSVRMFLDRARQVSPQFDLTPANTEAVIALCRRLEGIPLALELAAAWAGALSPAQILTRLERRFDLLVSRRTDLDARHRSLRATLEWSCAHLDPDLQRLFAHLGVFRGGWSLEAAESVCEETAVFDGLTRLAQRSLLATRTPNGEIRFSMLETLRDFAWERIAPDDLRSLSERHAAWYLTLAECAAPALTGPDQVLWLDRLAAEGKNFRAALHWFAQGVPREAPSDVGLCLAGALWRFWDVRGHHHEGQSWLETLLSGTEALRSPARARALEAAGCLASLQNDAAQARRRLEESIALAREISDTHRLASALCSLGEALHEASDMEQAREAFAEAEAIFRTRNDHYGLARTLAGTARIAFQSEDFETAQARYDHSAALYRIAGHLKGLASSIQGIGRAAGRLGETQFAQARLSEALALFRLLDDTRGVEGTLAELDWIRSMPTDQHPPDQSF